MTRRPILSIAFRCAGFLVPAAVLACQDGGSPTGIVVVPPGPTAGYVTLALGIQHTCGTRPEGTFCWGRNTFGQLGNGTTASSPQPVRIGQGEIVFDSLSLGNSHTCGLTGSGATWCWGRGDFGQLGIGVAAHRTLPAQVFLAGAELLLRSVDAGGSFTCGIDRSGAAWCWGVNTSGQLGDGTRTSSLAPVRVEGSADLVAIATGAGHACAIGVRREARCWGLNDHGQLGEGTTENRSSPVMVQGGVQFVAIGAGAGHTCGLSADGAVWCWGEGIVGQLGGGAPVPNRTMPVRVTAPVLFVQLGVGAGHTCALGVNGRAYCWGWNIDGQIGDGTAAVNKFVPVAVGEVGQFVRIAVGQAASCGIQSDGRAWCWGRNSDGELGVGDTASHLVPAPVREP